MKTLNFSTILQFSILVLGIFIASYLGAFRALPVQGSVGQGSEYYSTSTRTFNGTASPSVVLVKGGYGSLGSVIITGAAAGEITFFDATTSDVTKRATGQSTTTIEITDLPASLVAGTYVHDITYGRGLLMVITGTAPTSTVTYR